MTRELDSRIKELCGLIIREENSDDLLDLITELNQRLEERETIPAQGAKLVSNPGG